MRLIPTHAVCTAGTHATILKLLDVDQMCTVPVLLGELIAYSSLLGIFHALIPRLIEDRVGNENEALDGHQNLQVCHQHS